MHTGRAEALARFVQQLLDSPLLLLAVGLAAPTVLYLGWVTVPIVSTAFAR